MRLTGDDYDLVLYTQATGALGNLVDGLESWGR